MTRVLVFDQRRDFVELLRQQLDESETIETCCIDERAWSASSGNCIDCSSLGAATAVDTLIYSGRYQSRATGLLDLDHARKVFTRGNISHLRHVVLISSAAIYHPKYSNPCLITESRPTTSKTPNKYAEQWRSLESLANESISENGKLTMTILRPALALIPTARDYLSRVFQRRRVMRFVGYDPSIQLLGADDLARAVVCAVERLVAGTYNVAPRGVVPLRKALSRARVRSFPMPRLVQRPFRRVIRFMGAAPIDEADFIRYSFTISGDTIKRELGFEARTTSAQTLADFVADYDESSTHKSLSESFDDFGLDDSYLQWHGKWLFRFLERAYWRINVRGIEHIPSDGGAVLVGIHRGFMPLDGVLLVHLVNRYANRVPRILMHPALVKFPILAEFLMKIGGVIACERNADIVLNRGDLLGVFPEGIRGAFRMYRDAYRLDRLGRNDYVKFALRHQVPIVPFVYLGPAEAFPILARVDWPWWKRVTDWPFFPITPTWPWLPIPLPTKWRLRILEPIALDSTLSPEDAEDQQVVESIANQVRDAIHQNLVDMRAERHSILWERHLRVRDN